jgi:ubiquitin-activating enzyme E1 C
VYTHTVAYDRDAACPVCSAGVNVEMPATALLAELLEELTRRFPKLTTPSVSHGTQPLYAHGIYEEETKANLMRPLAELLVEGGVQEPLRNVPLMVNDKKSAWPLRIRLTLAAQH